MSKQSPIDNPYPKRRKNGAPRFKSINDSLAWWLKHQRSIIGINQELVAKRTGVSRATYSLYENAKRTPKLEDFVRLCEVLYIPYASVIDDADWKL